MTSVEKYIFATRFINSREDVPYRSYQIITLALMVDFMSFCSLVLRDSLNADATVEQTRSNICFTLDTFKVNIRYEDEMVFNNVFRAIISESVPAPPAPIEMRERERENKSSTNHLLSNECCQQRKAAQ